MPRYLILAQSDVTAEALNNWLGLLGEQPLRRRDPARIVWDRQGLPIVETYESLLGRIEGAARGHDSTFPINDVIALVDSIRPLRLSAVSEGGGWDTLLAMLILTFPEISWHFGVVSSPDTWGDHQDAPEKTAFPTFEHSLPALLARARRDPLLDPTGLRQWVRDRTVDDLKKMGDDTTLPKRILSAASLDDERDFAHYHAYTAYRFGCRGDAVSTWALMKDMFSGKGSHGYWLLLEDLSLNFPDKPGGTHLIELGKRADHCERLNSTDASVETSSHRIVVTAGPRQTGTTEYENNRNYLRNKVRGRGDIIFKPVGGMFDLWKKARLLKQKSISQCKGNVEHFLWPPAKKTTEKSLGKGSGHGSPGKLLLIAETLNRRAEDMREPVRSVSQAIQGAVLATDALELTAGRTPTTALQALRLKHEFEVVAECQFAGVEYHYAIEPRIEEIELVVKAACCWFHKKQQRHATLNATIWILSSLIQIFRKYGQFEEEQRCMNHVRRLQHSLWVRQRRIRYLVWPFLRYVEILLSSFAVFVAMLCVWVIVLTILFLFSFIGFDIFKLSGQEVINAFEAAIISFLSMAAPAFKGSETICNNFYYIVITIAAISGFVHLGIFISHLYAMLARK